MRLTKTPTVLVVDDEPLNIDLLVQELEVLGVDTISANNGREAIDYAVANPPDLVLADILMPVMDGFEMCREWKAHPILRSIPFVFYSGTYTEPKDQEFAFRLGADAFLAKGSDNHQFLIEVERLLSMPVASLAF